MCQCQSNLIDTNRKFSEKKKLQCVQNDVVVNFNDVIRIAHCALNMLSLTHKHAQTHTNTIHHYLSLKLRPASNRTINPTKVLA